jgi:hypothetical protein
LSLSERIHNVDPDNFHFSVGASGWVDAASQLISLDVQKGVLQALNRRLHEIGAMYSA